MLHQPITEYCIVDYDYLPFTFTRRHHSPFIGCYGRCPIPLSLSLGIIFIVVEVD